MNKQKRMIIQLQANAMRNTLKHTKNADVKDRKWAFRRYDVYKTSPKKAADIVSKMSVSHLAVILRACAMEHNYNGCYLPNSYWGNFYSVKTILLAATCKQWYHQHIFEKESGVRIVIGRFHGLQKLKKN